ncbi:MAG: cytoplasmic protein, partial [Candidatus Methanoperedens nitroreducens]
MEREILARPTTSEIISKVRQIEIKTNRPVEGIISGAYLSAFKGTGIEFSEVREYQAGDDPRTIDWNVTARMNHPFVKEFIEERDLTIVIVFDISRSSEFATVGSLKKDIGIELCASLAMSAIRNNDKVGLVLTSDIVEKYIPPMKGKRHVFRIIRETIFHEPEHDRTDLSVPL